MKTRKLVVRRPITVESFKLEKVWSKEGGVVEAFEGMYALRQEDIVEVTASRAKQLLTTSPETFSLKGREEIWLFLDNCCEEAEEEIVDFSRLWEEYRSWSEKQGKTSMLSEVLQDNGDLTAEMVGQAAHQGDKVALQAIERAAYYLGIGVLNLIHIFDPSIVILGGGVSKLGSLLFRPVRQLVHERAITSVQRETPIVPAALGDEVGLLGGVALVMMNEA